VLARERDRADGMLDPDAVHSWIDMVDASQAGWSKSRVHSDVQFSNNSRSASDTVGRRAERHPNLPRRLACLPCQVSVLSRKRRTRKLHCYRLLPDVRSKRIGPRYLEQCGGRAIDHSVGKGWGDFDIQSTLIVQIPADHYFCTQTPQCTAFPKGISAEAKWH
jgi:hypothetical protein